MPRYVLFVSIFSFIVIFITFSALRRARQAADEPVQPILTADSSKFYLTAVLILTIVKPKAICKFTLSSKTFGHLYYLLFFNFHAGFGYMLAAILLFVHGKILPLRRKLPKRAARAFAPQAQMLVCASKPRIRFVLRSKTKRAPRPPA